MCDAESDLCPARARPKGRTNCLKPQGATPSWSQLTGKVERQVAVAGGSERKV